MEKKKGTGEELAPDSQDTEMAGSTPPPQSQSAPDPNRNSNAQRSVATTVFISPEAIAWSIIIAANCGALYYFRDRLPIHQIAVSPGALIWGLLLVGIGLAFFVLTRDSIVTRVLGLIIIVGCIGGSCFYLRDHFRFPWESECDRVDRRCQEMIKSGDDLKGGLICGMFSMMTLGSRTEKQCQEANEALDEGNNAKTPSHTTY